MCSIPGNTRSVIWHGSFPPVMCARLPRRLRRCITPNGWGRPRRSAFIRSRYREDTLSPSGRNPNSQKPNPRQTKKSHYTKARLPFGRFGFPQFGIYLGFGFWDLDFTIRRQMNRRRLLSFLLAGTALALAAPFALKLVPIPSALLRPPIQSIALLDRTGLPLREARVAERFSRELALEEVPRHVIDAVLAAEDKRFFRHHGIDWLANVRAIVSGLSRGRIVSGASTITQQLVKISERRPRTLRSKLIESIKALRLEQSWSKNQILAAYLNRLDFGNLNIGLAAAADYYFDKPVSDLSDAEAAFLAGLPKNPRKLNPHVAADAAHRRKETVLRRMRDNSKIDIARYERARNESLTIRPPQRRFRAPHFVEMVLQQLPETPKGELKTTLDFRLNEQVEEIVRDRLAQLREQNVRNAAAVVIDNATGDVVALVGSENYFAPGAGQVNGAWAQRSAGSTLKPFTYLLALERGATPATVLADVRTSFPSADGFYRPENYNRRC